MIEIVITEEMFLRAWHRTKLVKNDPSLDLSKFGSEDFRIFVGYLGEEMVMSFLNVKKPDDNYEYDILFRNIKLEVKSIGCNTTPNDTYLATVNSCDLDGVHKQKADYYVFTRVLNDLSKGWLMGYISCTEFFEKGVYKKKGDNLIDGVDLEKANATVLPANQLRLIQELKWLGL